IIHHEAEADRLQGEADAHRWEAARLIAEELDGGKSGRQLAREINKTETHVRYMRKTWEENANLGSQDRPPFNEAYQAAKRGKAKPEPERSRPTPPAGVDPETGELRQVDPDKLQEAIAELKANQA